MSTYYVYCGEWVFLYIFESQVNGTTRRRRSSEYLIPDESTRLLQVEVLDDITDEVNTVSVKQGMRQHGCSGGTHPEIFGTSPFAPADFEAFSTICTG